MNIHCRKLKNKIKCEKLQIMCKSFTFLVIVLILGVFNQASNA